VLVDAMFRLHDTIYSSSYTSVLFYILLAVGTGVILGISIIISPFLSVILALGCIVVFVLIPRPLLMASLLIIATIFASGIPRGRLFPILTLNEAILLTTFVVTIGYIIANRTDKSLPGAILFASVVLIVGTAVIPIGSYLLRHVSLRFQDIFAMAAPVQYILLFWIFAVAPRSSEDRYRFVQLMFLCASIAAVVGLLQAFKVQWVVSFVLSWYPSNQAEVAAGLGRITSVFGSWNTLGTFYMLNLLVLIALQNEDFPRRYKINMLICGILSLFTLVASGSYASLIGLISGFFIIKLLDPRGLKNLVPYIVIFSLGVIILFPLISSRFLYQFGNTNGGIVPNTLAYRIKIWNEIYIPLIAKSPWWGVSPSFDNLWFSYAESQYLMLLYRSGIVSLVGFIIWCGSTFLWLWEIVRGEISTMRMIAVAVFSTMFVMLIMGITNPVFTYSGVMEYIWILLGLVANSQKDKLHVVY